MTELPTPLDPLLKSVAETRGKYEAAEARWKQLRAESRALTVQLVCDHGFSMAKASRLTGHHVNVIRVWVLADRPSEQVG